MYKLTVPEPEIPYTDDCFIMIQTNPLCDNVKAEVKNVTFRVEEEKNGKIVKSQVYQTKPTDLNNFESNYVSSRYCSSQTTFLILRGSS